MTTEKLYYNDSYVKQFTAEIVDTYQHDEKLWAVILDRTAFYPESGGQPADTGKLGPLDVVSVIEKDGYIIHLVSGSPETNEITGIIDWSRRFDHMQQHTGQHILSAAFHSVLGAETVGFHLGTALSQIDINLPGLNPQQVFSVETIANEVVFNNKPVRIKNISVDDLHSLPVRKPPAKQLASVRLIEIDGFDICPCGGTHVVRTGEVGLIKVLSWERKNNTIRVGFAAGYRALTVFQQQNDAVNNLAQRFSSAAGEIVQAADKHFARHENLAKQLTVVKQEYHQCLARVLCRETLKSNSVKVIIHVLPDATPSEVTALAKHIIAAEEKIIALLAGVNTDQNKAHLVFACSPSVDINMNLLLKSVLPIINGKGGGNQNTAQGGGSNITQVAAALAEAKQTILAML